MSAQPSAFRSFLRRHIALLLCLVLTFAVVAFIFGNSLQSREASGTASGFVSTILKTILDPNDQLSAEKLEHFVRKLAHFTEFFWLGMSVCGVLAGLVGGDRPLLSSCPVGSGLFFLLLIAVCDEWIQSFTGRGPSVQDVVLDFGGALCGLVFTALFSRWIAAVRQKSLAKRQEKQKYK